MKLYFNGCSHTFGDDLTDPLTQSWPAVLSQKLNCEFVNDSQSGGTNDRIMYRTVKHIDQFDKFYLAWTYTTRFTRYRADNNHDVNFNPQLVHSLYSSNPEFRLYGEMHYKFWHNELYNFKLWLQNIILLQSLFVVKNKPYVMVNAFNNQINRWSCDWSNFNNSVKSLLCFHLMDDQQLKNEHEEIQHLLHQIDYSRFIGWNSWWITKLNNDYTTGSTGHLLDDGHHAIANYILEHDSI